MTAIEAASDVVVEVAKHAPEIAKKAPTLKTAITRTAGRTGLILKKFSPQILTGIGIAGVVVAGVMACKATLKLEPIVEQTKIDLEKARNHESDERGAHVDKVYAKDITRIYMKAAFDVTKLYAPSVSMGMVGIACLVSGQGIMMKRNAALAAAYKTVEESFAKYRARVAEEIGEEQERDIRLGLKEEEVEIDGERTIVTKLTGVNSPYAVVFDSSNPNWNPLGYQNENFIKVVETFASQRLHAKGHIFLNEVYDDLGLPRTKEGQVVGWIMGKGGDEFVDFGVYNTQGQDTRDFDNAEGFILDFNVDGPIYDLI